MSKQAAGVCASYEASGLASLGNRVAYRAEDYDTKRRGRARNGGLGYASSRRFCGRDLRVGLRARGPISGLNFAL